MCSVYALVYTRKGCKHGLVCVSKQSEVKFLQPLMTGLGLGLGKVRDIEEQTDQIH